MNLLAWTLSFVSIASGQGGTPVLNLPPGYLSAAPPAERVVAKVNGQSVRASDIAQLVWDWRSSEATADIIDYLLVKQEALTKHVSVPQSEVEAEMAVQLKQTQSQVPAGQDAVTYLRNAGFPKSRLYMRLEAESLLKKLVLEGFAPVNFVKVSTLAFRPKSEQADAMSAAIKLAQGSYDRMAAGGDWDKELALTEADDTTKKAHGLVGWRLIDAFPKTVQDDLRKLAANGKTKPALVQSQTQSGPMSVIQIFRLDAAGKDAPAADMAQLKDQYLRSRLGPFLTALRAKAKIERFDAH